MQAQHAFKSIKVANVLDIKALRFVKSIYPASFCFYVAKKIGLIIGIQVYRIEKQLELSFSRATNHGMAVYKVIELKAHSLTLHPVF